jgi:hypothetical protein
MPKRTTVEHFKLYEDCINRLLDELAELAPKAAAE